jgi:hypothetical protein
VKHTTSAIDDLPLLPVHVDRRLNPDRRVIWRGGRRDSDWIARPLGAWQRLERETASPTGFRRLLSSINLW